MDNKGEEKFYVLKRILAILPLELIIFTSIMAVILSLYSKLNEIFNLNGEILNIIFVLAVILGIVLSFFSIRIFFRNKIKKEISKKVIMGMLIIQIIIFVAMLISGFNIIDQIIESMREEVSVEKIVWGNYYDVLLDNAIEIWKKYCLITTLSYTVGSFIGIFFAGIRMKKWTITNEIQEL